MPDWWSLIVHTRRFAEVSAFGRRRRCGAVAALTWLVMSIPSVSTLETHEEE